MILFGYASWQVLRRGQEELDPKIEVVRFAHWQLEPGVREAFDQISRDYMALHPHVRIVQMPIAGRVWRQWLRTQLVGGSPPDLIEIANYEVSDEMLARYFTPLTAPLEEKNPYNADEPDLRDMSWRRSFSAELVPEDLVHYYSPNLLEYYAVPNAMVTVRIFYNRDIIKAALGEDRVPQTYQEFVHWCEAVRDYAQRSGKPIMGLAGSWFNALQLTGMVTSTVTQKLAIAVDYGRDLDFTQQDVLITYLRGDWTMRTPAFFRSLKMVADIGRFMPPGWAQLNREDAMMQFVQGNVAMIPTGTWDAGGILSQADFEVGAFQVPAVGPDDPVYGADALGPISEANIFATVPFGLTRASKHPERAIDFLRFLTSRRENEVFSRISTWLPVIKGVPVPEVSKPFEPIKRGFIRGPSVRSLSVVSNDVYQQNIHLLSGKSASAETFVEQTQARYAEVVPAELTRMAKVFQATLRQKDSVLTALHHQTTDGQLARSKFDIVAAKQLQVEAQRLQIERTLADHEKR
ncbi:MAG: extracellular solute-binding protein [Opitutaceae bacterium]|nr:extracellular solute-binding protein [Opitutaceae bacterium]